jgi:hypothetical protein
MCDFNTWIFSGKVLWNGNAAKCRSDLNSLLANRTGGKKKRANNSQIASCCLLSVDFSGFCCLEKKLILVSNSSSQYNLALNFFLKNNIFSFSFHFLPQSNETNVWRTTIQKIMFESTIVSNKREKKQCSFPLHVYPVIVLRRQSDLVALVVREF